MENDTATTISATPEAPATSAGSGGAAAVADHGESPADRFARIEDEAFRAAYTGEIGADPGDESAHAEDAAPPTDAQPDPGPGHEFTADDLRVIARDNFKPEWLLSLPREEVSRYLDQARKRQSDIDAALAASKAGSDDGKGEKDADGDKPAPADPLDAAIESLLEDFPTESVKPLRGYLAEQRVVVQQAREAMGEMAFEMAMMEIARENPALGSDQRVRDMLLEETKRELGTGKHAGGSLFSNLRSALQAASKTVLTPKMTETAARTAIAAASRSQARAQPLVGASSTGRQMPAATDRKSLIAALEDDAFRAAYGKN